MATTDATTKNLQNRMNTIQAATNTAISSLSTITQQMQNAGNVVGVSKSSATWSHDTNTSDAWSPGGRNAHNNLVDAHNQLLANFNSTVDVLNTWLTALVNAGILQKH